MYEYFWGVNCLGTNLTFIDSFTARELFYEIAVKVQLYATHTGEVNCVCVCLSVCVCVLWMFVCVTGRLWVGISCVNLDKQECYDMIVSYRMVSYGVMWCDVKWCDVMWCNIIKYHMIW